MCKFYFGIHIPVVSNLCFLQCENSKSNWQVASWNNIAIRWNIQIQIEIGKLLIGIIWRYGEIFRYDKCLLKKIEYLKGQVVVLPQLRWLRWIQSGILGSLSPPIISFQCVLQLVPTFGSNLHPSVEQNDIIWNFFRSLSSQEYPCFLQEAKVTGHEKF